MIMAGGTLPPVIRRDIFHEPMDLGCQGQTGPFCIHHQYHGDLQDTGHLIGAALYANTSQAVKISHHSLNHGKVVHGSA